MNPRVVLLYPPNQSLPGVMCKPNGSLAYPYLASALMARGVEVRIFDACVGGANDDLAQCFYQPRNHSARHSPSYWAGVSGKACGGRRRKCAKQERNFFCKRR